MRIAGDAPPTGTPSPPLTQRPSPFAGCDWLEMTYNASAATASGGASTGGSDASSVQKANPAQFSCQPWIPDASKFTTSGNVCNLDQMMKQYAGGSTGGSYGGYP